MMDGNGAAARDLLRAFLRATEKDDVGAAVARMLATAREEYPEVLEECLGGVRKLEWWLEDCEDYDIRELMPNLPPGYVPTIDDETRDYVSGEERRRRPKERGRACRRTTPRGDRR
jgi:hypothetical protein